MARADNALYASKAGARNRVSVDAAVPFIDKLNPGSALAEPTPTPAELRLSRSATPSMASQH